MARPRRSTAEAFYDVFADFTVEDQAAALTIMEQIHRLAVRDQARRSHDAAVDRQRESEEGSRADADMDRTSQEVAGERCPPRE